MGLPQHVVCTRDSAGRSWEEVPLRSPLALSTLLASCLATLGACSELWVSPSGDDAAPGAKGAPLRTIQHAVDRAQPGDTVWVRAGRYEECVSIPLEKSGREGQWLTISAAPGDERKAIVGIETPRVDAYGSGSSAFSMREVQYVRIRGFHCVAPYRGRGSGIGASRSQHFEIINCVVTGGGQGGVDANHCDHVTIDGVEAYFNGGGSGWSSGISLLEPKTKDNVVRNCVCYGNYDGSSYRTDGNGIIIDNAYHHGGALLINNLCFMNGGKGICSTRSDDCTFLHNTCAMNCWQSNQQSHAHELSVRGAGNILRNNIGVSTIPGGVGLQVLLAYGGPDGQVNIDPKSILCDHNLFHNPHQPECVVKASDRGRELLTLQTLGETEPQWARDTLSVDPGFVDMQNFDFRLRPGSPALRAGIAVPEAHADLLGRPRAQSGPCAIGCYEGPYDAPIGPQPIPEVVVADGEHADSIKALLENEYDLEWEGMLWGWGKLLYEELPLVVEVEGARKADFLALSGRYGLGELLDKIAHEHSVRLVLRQPEDCQGAPAAPTVVSNRLSIREDADADERAYVRQALRVALWTEDQDGRVPLTELVPASCAALGIKVESTPPVPPDWKCPMVTRNMKLSAALLDLAQRLDARFTLSRDDPLDDEARVRTADLDQTFGGENGIVEITVEKPDGRGRIDMFARVQPEVCLNARLFMDNSRFLAPAGIDDTGAGDMYHKMSARLTPGCTVRLAVVGNGCALNVDNKWLLLNRMPADLTTGGFRVRTVSEWVEVGDIRFVEM